MLPATLSPRQRWLYALKPQSWPKLLVPALLGQALGISATGQIALRGLALGALFTALDACYIVFLNDWGDREVDAIKRQMFPHGGSPKTICDGILPAGQVLAAGISAGIAAFAVACISSALLHRWELAAIGGACLLLFSSYSLPPIRLNYRGGGELLEAVGVGIALPAFNAYTPGGAAGALARTSLAVLPAFVFLSIASAIASGLSDEESDRAGGKSTIATRLGNRRARAVVELFCAAAIVAWGIASWCMPHVLPLWVSLPAISIVFFQLLRLRDVSPRAVTNAFREQGAYKTQLHRGIWFGTAALAVLLGIASRLHA